jgi:hypothetical protein
MATNTDFIDDLIESMNHPSALTALPPKRAGDFNLKKVSRHNERAIST